MTAIVPNPQAFQQLAAAPDTGPVVMLNLLKFKKQATDGSGTGAEAYGRYGEAAVKFVEERGGKILWQGRAEQLLVGEPDVQDWDVVALVQYPSRKSFLEMVSNPDYMKSHGHREAGLEKTVLLACRQVGRAALFEGGATP
jgi:uncharacterized protein (DUF1330 family)